MSSSFSIHASSIFWNSSERVFIYRRVMLISLHSIFIIDYHCDSCLYPMQKAVLTDSMTNRPTHTYANIHLQTYILHYMNTDWRKHVNVQARNIGLRFNVLTWIWIIHFHSQSCSSYTSPRNRRPPSEWLSRRVTRFLLVFVLYGTVWSLNRDLVQWSCTVTLAT